MGSSQTGSCEKASSEAKVGEDIYHQNCLKCGLAQQDWVTSWKQFVYKSHPPSNFKNYKKMTYDDIWWHSIAPRTYGVVLNLGRWDSAFTSKTFYVKRRRFGSSSFVAKARSVGSPSMDNSPRWTAAWSVAAAPKTSSERSRLRWRPHPGILWSDRYHLAGGMAGNY